MKINKFLVSVIGLTLVATLIAYPVLPQQIPTHWNINGDVDGYSPRWMAIVLACLPAFMYGLFGLCQKLIQSKNLFLNLQKHMNV